MGPGRELGIITDIPPQIGGNYPSYDPFEAVILLGVECTICGAWVCNQESALALH